MKAEEKTGSEKISYIFLCFRKRNFLTFQETELPDPKSKKFLEVIFRAPKVKKKPFWKNFLYLKECNFLTPSSYTSGRNLQNRKIKTFLYFSKKVISTSVHGSWSSRKTKKNYGKKNYNSGWLLILSAGRTFQV